MTPLDRGRAICRALSVATLVVILEICAVTAWAAADTSRLARDEFARRLVVDADTVRQLAVFEMVHGRPASDNDIIVPWTVQNADRLIPMFLYDLAGRLFNTNRDGALDWYAIALVRARYDANRCADPIVENIGALKSDAGRELLDDLTEHPEAFADAAARVLRRPQLMVDEISPLWICLRGVRDTRTIPPGHTADPATAVKPALGWPSIREGTWEDFATMAAGKQQLPGPVQMGRVVKRLLHKEGPGSVAWSPDGKLIASESFTNIFIWDAETGRLLHDMGTELTPLHSLAFTADGRYLLTTRTHDQGTRRPGSVTVWDVRTGELVRDIGDGDYPTQALSLSLDGRTLAVATHGRDSDIAFYDTGSWTRIGKIAPQEIGTVYKLAFSPDGKRLAVDADDIRGLSLYDVISGQLVRKVAGHGGSHLFHSFAYSADGQYIASSVYAHEKAPSGMTLAEVRIWNVADGTLARTLDEKFSDVDGLSWSPDGKYLAVASDDSTVHLWEVESGQVKAVVTLGGPVTWVAFSPDSKRLAAVDGVVAAIIEVEP
jgi:sugar lactone lactonase YvrE